MILPPSDSNWLIQLWAPVWIANRKYLTTADQPFGIGNGHKGLLSYRKLCLEKILIPVFVDELSDEVHNLGVVGRVFRYGVRESCSDICYYLSKEFLKLDCALELGLKCCLAVPLFESVDDGHCCIGVLEMVSTESLDNYGFIFDFDVRLLKVFLSILQLIC